MSSISTAATRPFRPRGDRRTPRYRAGARAEDPPTLGNARLRRRHFAGVEIVDRAGDSQRAGSDGLRDDGRLVDRALHVETHVLGDGPRQPIARTVSGSPRGGYDGAYEPLDVAGLAGAVFHVIDRRRDGAARRMTEDEQQRCLEDGHRV